MKKYLNILFTLIILLMICACGQEDVDDAQVDNADIADHVDPMEETEPIQEAEANAPAEDESDMIQEEEINALAEAETVILPEEEKIVYEAYLAANSDNGNLYAYFDYDNDGRQELYLRSDAYGRVWKYVDGGLKWIESGKISEKYINGLEWNEIAENDSDDSANSEEMVHEGVYVYVDQNPYGEDHFWYVDENAFLSQYGFGESAPFYEYALPDGSMRLVLYYDEATGLGCGFRYYQRDPDEWTTSGVYGFSFMGLVEESNLWTDRLDVDYTKFESCWGDTPSSSWDENIEYDDAGRVAHYEAYEPVDGETVRILNMYYEYDDNGTLRQRQYYHYHLRFSSTFQYWYSYFDELGRVEYERAYITHGSLEYYYIYLDGSDEPAYSLFLDNNLGTWMPDFAKL